MELTHTVWMMMDVSWMKFFFRSVICQHIWFSFLKLNYAHVRNGRHSHAWFWFNKWCERYISIFAMSSSLHPSVSTLYCIRFWPESKDNRGEWVGTETLYNLWLIHFKFSLWSHIKLPRDVIISLVSISSAPFYWYQQDFMPVLCTLFNKHS